MNDRTLRAWRSVVPVAAPSGVAVETRLRTTTVDDRVLDLVAEHLGRLRRADLAAVSQPVPLDPALDAEQRRQVRRDRLNARKKALTGQSSARWANAIIAGNDDQYRLAREAQYRHIGGLRSAIATIEARLAAPPPTLSPSANARPSEKLRPPKGMRTKRNASRSSAGCSIYAVSSPRLNATGPPVSCMWWRAVNASPTPVITSMQLV